MRLSIAVASLIVSLSSSRTTAFGNFPPTSSLSRNFASAQSTNVAFCRGGVSPLGASASVVGEAVTSENLAVLSERGQAALTSLVEHDDGSQSHVYADWPEPGTDDEGKKQLGEQVSF